MLLDQPIEMLIRTAPATVKRLRSLNVNTFGDLIFYFPFRYNDLSLKSEIGRAQSGEIVTLQGEIIGSKNETTRRGLMMQKIKLSDGTGSIEIVWYNQPYITGMLPVGTQIAVGGVVRRFLHGLTLEPIEYEIIRFPSQKLLHTGRLVPIYPETRGISSKTIREKVRYVLDQLASHDEKPAELLPKVIREYNNLVDIWTAVQQIHFPDNHESGASAKKRLAFDELFLIQLSAALIRLEWQKETVTTPFTKSGFESEQIKEFIENLPFKLTDSQLTTVKEIFADLAKKTPMNRFVQGDVGSGKTVVAAIAAYGAFLNGFQTLIMAPTEILAEQHYRTIENLFKKYPVKTALQTGATKMLKTDTDFDIIIGTQAILTKSVTLKKVGLVVIDEQHRFGVAQRATLKDKGINPHLLTMTATPIPRTVSLTLYGELDLSVINEMPKGRLPIKTYLVSQNKRDDAYIWIKKQIKATGSQVFIICPLIEESDKETMKSVRAASAEYKRLSDSVFPELKLVLLHGRMKPKEKEAVMNDFKNRKYDILVSTSVVEVGIDIPNASIMMIEGSERYGLAQLHQLRGRVGRGDKQSYCLVFSDAREPSSIQRLKFFASTNSGMKLAEYDLKLRGPGTIYGTQQSGYLDLKMADFSDTEFIKQVKNAVNYFLSHHSETDLKNMKKKIEKFRADQIARD